MSYPSLDSHLNALGVTPETASEEQLHEAYFKAFETDLPLGMEQVEILVQKMKSTGQRALHIPTAESNARQEYVQLFAPDIPRQILEKKYGCVFGFYNCHAGVAAPKKDQLNMSLIEQAKFQDPAFVDC